jgi:two-component system chemotaxis response regulator CheB
VLIVDDSAVVRGLLIRWLEQEPGVAVAGVAMNGREAVRQAEELRPCVIVLDVEMPELDGIGAIPEILAKSPESRILMASTLTKRNAEITLKALSLGASDYLPKPETGRIAASADFKRDLVSRVRALGAARRPHTEGMRRPVAAPSRPALAGLALPERMARPAEAIVIGSSTGGPQALNAVIAAIGGRVRAPIVIVQHMPAMFTAILADHLSKISPAQATEARHGEPLRPGAVYVAPGDFHLRLVRKHGAPVIQLDQSPPVNFCRPAVDPMFESAAECFKDAVLGAVLTGMGSDGRKGAEALVRAGNVVIAQDEATSVVWGMPGAVVNAGLSKTIRPLAEIGPTIAAMAQGRQR